MPIMCENSKIKLLTSDSIQKIYCENNIVYSSGNNVFYHAVDKLYAREFDEGEDILHPDFTVSVSGATFLGWSDSPNSTTVLTSKIMGDDPIHLYAVVQYSNVSVPANLPGGNVVYSTFTVATNVDCYKYYAASYYFQGKVCGKGSTGYGYAYLQGGGGSTTVGYAGGDNCAWPSSTFTVNFAQTSGLTNIVANIGGGGYGYDILLTVGSSVTLYGRKVTSRQVNSVNVTVKAYNGSNLIFNETKEKYIMNNIINIPTFTIPDQTPSEGMIFRGWTENLSGSHPKIKYTTVNNTSISEDTILYAIESEPNVTFSSGFGTNNKGQSIDSTKQIYLAGEQWYDGAMTSNSGGTVTVMSGIDCAQYMGVYVPIAFSGRPNTNSSQSNYLACGGTSVLVWSGSAGNSGPASRVNFTNTYYIPFTSDTGTTNLTFTCNANGSNPYNYTSCTLQGDIILVNRPVAI